MRRLYLSISLELGSTKCLNLKIIAIHCKIEIFVLDHDHARVLLLDILSRFNDHMTFQPHTGTHLHPAWSPLASRRRAAQVVKNSDLISGSLNLHLKSINREVCPGSVMNVVASATSSNGGCASRGKLECGT